MKLLLDTHIFLWSLLEPNQLSKQVVDALEKPSNELWLSPITTWEIMILAEKKRITLSAHHPAEWLKEVYSRIPFKEAPLNHEIALKSCLLDLPHQDPADRFLVATALIYNLTFITADHSILSCEHVKILPN